MVSQNCHMKHFHFKPTSPVAKGHVLAIWESGAPHQSTKKTVFNPKICPFSLATFQEGEDQYYSLKVAIWSIFISCPTSTVAWGHVLTIWDQNNNIYSRNKPVFLNHFPRGWRPVILYQNCHNNHFHFLTHLTHGKGPCIGHPGP